MIKNDLSDKIYLGDLIYYLGENKSPSKTVLLFITVISCTKFNFCVEMVS